MSGFYFIIFLASILVTVFSRQHFESINSDHTPRKEYCGTCWNCFDFSQSLIATKSFCPFYCHVFALQRRQVKVQNSMFYSTLFTDIISICRTTTGKVERDRSATHSVIHGEIIRHPFLAHFTQQHTNIGPFLEIRLVTEGLCSRL